MAIEQQPSQDNPSIPLYALLWYASLRGVTHQEQIVKGVLLLVPCSWSTASRIRAAFWVLDLALAVTSGAPWRGRPTRKGLVIYVAGEGGASVRAASPPTA